MHKAVKEDADNGNIKGLKYIFADCLNVDPTFEKYKEDYEYCQREVPGLFEQHKDMTPLTENQKDWNYDYWRELKIDLVDNFSKKRFEHMIRVAKVVYAEKIKIINEKREAEYKEAQDIARQKTDNIMNNNIGIYNRRNTIKTKSKKEEQEKEIREAKEKLARENSYIEEREKQQQQIRDIGSQRKISGQNIKNNEKEDGSLKKLIGVLLGIVIILVFVIVILSQ